MLSSSSPVISSGIDLHKPKDAPAFERLCADLFEQLLDDVHTDQHGRNGQGQKGVDLYGTDRASGVRVGVECKKRSQRAGSCTAELTVGELDEIVARARAFLPSLERLVVLTSGRTDQALQSHARHLSSANVHGHVMEVIVHGWDWIERQARRYPDLALRHHLLTTISPALADQNSRSTIAQQIGARLAEAISRMNVRRSDADLFTVQSLARHLGHPDWRQLEAVLDGAAPAGDALLQSIAHGLGLSADWLIEGKGGPFALDNICHHLDTKAIYADLIDREPLKVVFVRRNDPEFDHYDVILCVQLDAVRWITCAASWPGDAVVGSGGREDLIALYCLVRRLELDLRPEGTRCNGAHVDTPTLDGLSTGEIYPGARFTGFRNDCWPIFLGKLQTRYLKSERREESSLIDAIEMLRTLVRGEGGKQHLTAISAALVEWASEEPLSW